MTPATFVFFLLVFTVVGVVFLFIHLLMGSFIRPNVPDPEKLTIYECGEPTVGSAWVQFDLRYYVVALLFVIFDVEVAFFFPWATVFGKANQLARIDDPAIVTAQEKTERLDELDKQRKKVDKQTELDAQMKEKRLADIEKQSEEVKRHQVVSADEKVKRLADVDKQREKLTAQLMPSGVSNPNKVAMGLVKKNATTGKLEAVPISPEAAARWAQIAFWDIAIFFGVLMVGFAYVWRRGDIDWVRAYGHHHEPAAAPEKPLEQHAAPLASTPPTVAVH